MAVWTKEHTLFVASCCAAVQDAFGWLLGLLQALARQPAGRQALQASPASLKQMAGVAQLLARRVEIEGNYISRLEGAPAVHASHSGYVSADAAKTRYAGRCCCC